MGVLEAGPRDAMLRTALDCYLRAIMSVADCVSILYPEAVSTGTQEVEIDMRVSATDRRTARPPRR
jgi:hypothetical protein